MSITSVVGLISSAICYLCTPIVYNYKDGLALPLWSSFILCVLGLVCSLAVAAITRRAENTGIIPVKIYIEMLETRS